MNGENGHSNGDGNAQSIVIEGYTIYFETYGHGDHKLLLIPGLLGTVQTDYYRQIEHFDKDKFTLIVVDAIGYGRSQPPEKDYAGIVKGGSHKREAGLLAQLLQQHLGINKLLAVFGFSNGSRIAIYLAADYPDLIQKLVIIGGSVFVSDIDRRIFPILTDLSNWGQEDMAMFRAVYGDRLESIWRQSIEGFKGVTVIVPRDDLLRVKCPAFILHGGNDYVALTNPHASYLNINIKKSKLHIFKGMPHRCHCENASYKEFNKLVQEWLLK